MVNYTLDPLKIKLEIEENSDKYKDKYTDYKVTASYRVFLSMNSNSIIEVKSDVYTSKDNAIKNAIEKLEWEVYRYKLEHNKYNEFDYEF